MKTLTAGLIAFGLLAGCNAEDPLMRMNEQKKAKPFAYTPFFADGRVNRVPPMGTVPREKMLEVEMQTQPVYTTELLHQGRRRYEIVCATCHGFTGEADSIVAGNMALRPPPSFHEDRLKQKDDRYIYDAISKGYGMMPAFPEISAQERWAVVAYVRALQLSQRAALAEAPAEEQQQLLSTPEQKKENL